MDQHTALSPCITALTIVSAYALQFLRPNTSGGYQDNLRTSAARANWYQTQKT